MMKWMQPLWRHYWQQVLLLVALQELVRIVMHLVFYRSTHSLMPTLQAHWLGLRFDLRVAVLAVLPMLLVACLPWLRNYLHPHFAKTAGLQRICQRAWAAWFALITAAWLLVVFVDFGNLAYWQQRIDATLLNYAGDWQDNALVIWQTYPVIALLLLLLAVAAAQFFVSLRLMAKSATPIQPTPKLRWRIAAHVSMACLVLFCIHGRWSQYPLRWSDTSAIGQADLEKLALNPIQQIADTLAYRKPQYNLAAVEKNYDYLAQWLQVEPRNNKSFSNSRPMQPLSPAPIPAKANVVLIILESFSGYKSSLFQNKLNTTPFIKSLADQGWLFPHFFSAHPGTARGVYSLMTSGPDLSLGDTASRNPKAINHRSYITDFEGHTPFYFIGGSTSWANIRGTLLKAVPGIKIFEESDYRYPRVDVWGVSDLNLMLEANRLLNEQAQGPFFAVIQTAANHRPYTIPADSPGFVSQQVSPAELRANGFDSVEEFNAFRLLDYSVEQFFQAAKQSPWFDNTVFILTGDHGIPNAQASNMPRWLYRAELTSIHTPLVMYAPQWLAPKRIETLGQQADLLPTLLAMTGRTVPLRSIGRNLMQTNPEPPGVFWIDHSGPSLGWYDGRYFARQAPGQPAQLFDLTSDNVQQDRAKEQPALLQQLQQHMNAYFEVGRYWMMQSSL